MAILKIEARIECDGCGKPFEVHLDPAAHLVLRGETLFDLVIDHIEGQAFMSHQGEHMLCPACTRKVDAALDDDATPSHEEVAAALDAAAEADSKTLTANMEKVPMDEEHTSGNMEHVKQVVALACEAPNLPSTLAVLTHAMAMVLRTMLQAERQERAAAQASDKTADNNAHREGRHVLDPAPGVAALELGVDDASHPEEQQ